MILNNGQKSSGIDDMAMYPIYEKIFFYFYKLTCQFKQNSA